MKLLFLLAALLSFFATTAQPRFTDSTFGTNGKVFQNTSLPSQYVTDVVLQPDGKSVTLAEAEYHTVTRIVLIRYNTNGTLDASFSGDGIADSMIEAGVNYYPSAIKLQADGKLLVCGHNSGDDYARSAFVIRYNTNGSLDATFGTDGIVYLPYFTVGNTTTNTAGIKDLVVLPNNKLMLLTEYNSVDSINLKLIQLNPNGTIDSSFGTNGTVWLTTSPWANAVFYKILLQANGKYVVGGYAGYNSSATASFALIRINPNGTVDGTYGTNGILTANKGSADNEQVRDMAMQPDGKIIISGIGSTYFDMYEYLYITRATSSGTVDASFASGGTQRLYYTTGGFTSTEGQISLQTDGKVLLAGSTTDAGGFYKMAIARLTTAGMPDASFDGDGIATLQINQYASYGIATVQQANGSIVVSGYASSNNAASAAMARLTAGGQTDNTVATANNIAYIGAGHDYEGGYTVHIQAVDQKIIDVKERYNGVTYDLRVSRYLPNGTPDPAFGTGGHTIIPSPGSGYYIYSTLLSNGKIMIVTLQSDYIINSRIELVRLNTNGTIDSSYGLNGRLLVPAGNNNNLISHLNDVAFQPDDKVLLLTTQYNLGIGIDSSFLIRLNPNGSLDASFNNTGRKYLTPSSPLTTFLQIALQNNGKIIMAENLDIGPSNNFQNVVARLNTDGSRDNTFNGGNIAVIPLSDIWNMIVQPDNKIILNNNTTTFYRLDGNGAPDNTFGVAGSVDLSAFSPGYSYSAAVYAIDSGKLFVTCTKSGYQPNDLSYTQIVKLKSNGQPDSSFGVNAAIRVEDIYEVYTVQSPLAIQADGKIVITGDGVADTTTLSYGDAVLVRLKPVGLSFGRLYIFTGSGLWSNPANWSGGMMPPSIITAGNSVVISTPAGGQCTIDIPVTVQHGASFTVSAGSTLLLPGNLTIQ